MCKAKMIIFRYGVISTEVMVAASTGLHCCRSCGVAHGKSIVAESLNPRTLHGTDVSVFPPRPPHQLPQPIGREYCSPVVFGARGGQTPMACRGNWSLRSSFEVTPGAVTLKVPSWDVGSPLHCFLPLPRNEQPNYSFSGPRLQRANLMAGRRWFSVPISVHRSGTPTSSRMPSTPCISRRDDISASALRT